MNTLSNLRLAAPILLLSILGINFSLLGQSDTISANTNSDAEELVRDIFLGGGQCFEVFNVELSGQVGQAGTFSNGLASVGFDGGLILSNGNVETISGPNLGFDFAGADVSTSYGVVSSDPDLDILSTLEGEDNPNFFDAVVLEFDFTPTLDSISFDFVFASEEYCDFSLTTFVDLFGFFISGPGISGPYSDNGINLAVVPGTGEAITARNVSPFLNPTYYQNNIPPGEIGCSFGLPAPASDFMAFDGYTVPLVASTTVIPCETYHLKLIVADRGFDDQLDAAVFLRANSFAAGLTSRITSQVTGPSAGDDSPYEGCGFTSIIFSRGDTVTTDDLVVYYDLAGSSTATPGLDYMALPDSVIIPAGQLTDTINLDFFADDIIEGTEFFTIKLRNPCDCSESELTINILEPPPVSAAIVGPDRVCDGEGIALAGVPSGGIGTITYEWSNGDMDSLFNFVPSMTDTYELIVSDECNATDTVRQMVRVQSPSASIDGDIILCDGRPQAPIPIVLNDGDIFSFDVFENGNPTSYSNIATDTFFLPVSITGVYQIGNLNADGCAGTTSGDAQVLQVEIDTPVSIDSIDCFGDANGAISLNPVGGTGVYNYSWEHDMGLTTDSIGSLDIGNYTAFISDSNGCLDTVAVAIDQPTLLEVSVDTLSLSATCLEGGSLEASAQGGTGNYTFNWSDGGTGTLNEDLIAQAYTLSVNDENGCIATATTVISSDSIPPLVSIQALDTLDCATMNVVLDATDSSQGGDLTYQWTDPSGTPLSPSDPLLLDVLDAGNYTLSITNNDNGCSSIDSVAVVMVDSGLAISIGGDTNLSCFAPDGRLFFRDSMPDFQTNWELLDGTPVATNLNSIDVTDAGDYVLLVTQVSTGCMGRDTITVTANENAPVLSLMATPDTLTCEIDQALLDVDISNGSGNYTYEWEGPAGGISGSDMDQDVVGTSPGIYQLIAIDSDNGCRDTLSYEIIQDLTDGGPVLSLTVTPDTLTCEITQAMLDVDINNGSGNYTYEWEGPAGGISGSDMDQDVVGTSPGIYQLIAIDSDSGCRDTLNYEVIQDLSDLVINPIPDTVLNCAMTQVSLTASSPNSGNLSFEWFDSQGGSIVQNASVVISAADTYTIALTDLDNNCTQVATIEVATDTIRPQVTALLPDELNCENVTTELGVEPGPDSYSLQWRTAMGDDLPSTTWTQMVDEGGGYVLTVTDDLNGCRSSVLFDVMSDTVAPIVLLDLADTINCLREQVNLTPSSISGSGSYEYNWDGPAGGIIGPSDGMMVDVEAEGLYTLILTDLDNACTDTVTAMVEVDQVDPELLLLNDTTLNCFEPEATLSGDSDSDGILAYEWFDETGTSLVQSPDLLVNDEGTYRLLLTNTTNGCTDELTVDVDTDFAEPMANAGTDEIITCSDNTVSLNGEEGPSNWIPTWSNEDGMELSSGSWELETSEAGMYTLTVLDNLNGCSNTDEAVVTADQSFPSVVVNNEHLIDCFDNTATIDASGTSEGPDFIYSIENDNGVTILQPSTLVFEIPNPGDYQLIVTNTSNNCDQSASFTVSLDVPSITSLEVDDIPCGATSGTIAFSEVLDGVPPYLYSIDNGNTFSAGPIFAGLEAGSYSLLVQDVNGCEASSSATIVEATGVAVDLEEQVELSLFDEYELTPIVSNAFPGQLVEIKWSGADSLSCTDCLNPIFTALETTRLTISVTDDNGCSATATILLIVDRQVPVFIPNVFSPDGLDGANDSFGVFADPAQVAIVSQMHIFDRWGGHVFSKTDIPINTPSEGWDGRANGTLLNPGVYVYWLEVLLQNGETQILEGDVTLLR